jgi:hypothetical protein
MDMARTERLTEEVRARAGTRPASGSEGDWGAGLNIGWFRCMAQDYRSVWETAKRIKNSRLKMIFEEDAAKVKVERPPLRQYLKADH